MQKKPAKRGLEAIKKVEVGGGMKTSKEGDGGLKGEFKGGGEMEMNREWGGG